MIRPLRIAISYLLAAALWIVFSDAIAAWLATDKETLALFQLTKGWLFVLATAGFILVMLYRVDSANDRTTSQAKSGVSSPADLAEQFQAVAMANCDAFLIRDHASGDIDFISPGFDKLFGVSDQDLLRDSKVLATAVHPDDRDMMAAFLDGKDDSRVRLRLRAASPGGVQRWVQAVSARGARINGMPFKQSLMFHDITQEVTHDHQVSRQRDLAKQYLDVTGAIMVAIDANENVVMVNKTGCEILGYPEEEILGRNWFDYFVPEDVRARVRTVLARSATELSDTVGENENPVLIKGGATRLIKWRNLVLRNDNGEFVTTLSYGEDITEQRKAQKSRLRLMRAIEHAADGIAIVNTDGAAEYVNPSFVAITGAQDADIIGSSIFDYIAQGGPGQSANMQLSVLAKAAKGPYQTRMLDNDEHGRDKNLEMTISPIREKNQLVSGFVVVLRDVTDMRQLENKLRQSQKMEAIGTLAGGIAHDFNNILGSIIGYTELAAWDMDPESKQKRHLEQVLMAGERAKELVSQILSFSRQGEKERRPIKIGSIIKETVKLLRASLPATIEIESKLEKETGTVLSDPVQVQQVVMNLATNAAQAIGEHTGRIAVSLQEKALDSDSTLMHPGLKPGSYTVLSVSDTGLGISKENIHKIFDPYFSTKEPGEGTGLGLAMVHGIVNSHGGSVSVYSEPGQGTTFRVYLPRIGGEANEPAAFDYSVYRGSERVLLVDDEAALAAAFCGMLGKMGYQVTTQDKPNEALELFRQDPEAFDLVITDYAMPAMSGTDLAKEMKVLRPDVPIILCTGFSESISRKMAGTMGFAEFVEKPVLAGELAKAIRGVMDDTE